MSGEESAVLARIRDRDAAVGGSSSSWKTGTRSCSTCRRFAVPASPFVVLAGPCGHGARAVGTPPSARGRSVVGRGAADMKGAPRRHGGDRRMLSPPAHVASDARRRLPVLRARGAARSPRAPCSRSSNATPSRATVDLAIVMEPTAQRDRGRVSGQPQRPGRRCTASPRTARGRGSGDNAIHTAIRRPGAAGRSARPRRRDRRPRLPRGRERHDDRGRGRGQRRPRPAWRPT